jgi:hypothetical protein
VVSVQQADSARHLSVVVDLSPLPPREKNVGRKARPAFERALPVTKNQVQRLSELIAES